MNTEIVTKLTIFSYCYKIISADGKHDYPLRINQTPSCADDFLRQLKADMTTLWASLRINHPIIITPEQQRLFELQDRCALCQVKFRDLPKSAKHRDHDHLRVCVRFEASSLLHYILHNYNTFFSLSLSQEGNNFTTGLCRECNMQYYR